MFLRRLKYLITFIYAVLIAVLSAVLTSCLSRTAIETVPSTDIVPSVIPTIISESSPFPVTLTVEPTILSPSSSPACPDGSSLAAGVANELLWQFGLSPQGNAIAKIEQGGHSLVIEDLVSLNKKTVLNKLPYEIQYLAWSPNGEFVAYSVIDKQPSGEWFWRVEVIHIDTQTMSTDFYPGNWPGIPMDELPPQYFNILSWSPKGTYILLIGPNRPFQIVKVTCSAAYLCTAELHSVGTKDVTNALYGAFAWSPSENLIAYACTTTYETETDDPFHPNIEFEYGLCLDDVDGNPVTEFKAETLGVENIRSLTWSPDGTKISFTATEIGRSDLDVFVLNLADDEAVLNLTRELVGDQQDPIWLP